MHLTPLNKLTNLDEYKHEMPENWSFVDNITWWKGTDPRVALKTGKCYLTADILYLVLIKFLMMVLLTKASQKIFIHVAFQYDQQIEWAFVCACVDNDGTWAAGATSFMHDKNDDDHIWGHGRTYGDTDSLNDISWWSYEQWYDWCD